MSRNRQEPAGQEPPEDDRKAEAERVSRLVQQGVDQLDRGDVAEGEDVFRRLAEKHRNLGSKP